MKTQHRVMCTVQIDGRIVAVGAGGRRWATAEVIQTIRSGAAGFYTEVDGQRAVVVVRGRPPNEYLATDRDTTIRNNLDSLPPCG